MQRESADRHSHRNDPGRLLILDVIAGPGMFAVQHRALEIAAAILDVENRAACLDHGDVAVGPQRCELLRQHRGSYAAADDQDVGFVNRHVKPSAPDAGW